MMNKKLLALAIALLIFANVYAWTKHVAAGNNADDAAAALSETQETSNEIKELQTSSLQRLSLAPRSYDFADTIVTMFENAGIKQDDYSRLAAVPVKTDGDESGLSVKSIQNPLNEPLEMSELLAFLEIANQTTPTHAINSLRLAPATVGSADSSSGVQNWNAQFTLYFLQSLAE